MSASTLAIVRRMWASQLGVPLAALERPGMTLTVRPSMTAVVVVDLDGAAVTVGPSHAIDLLGGLAAESTMDMSGLLTALDAYAPRSIGSASLAYGDAGTLAERPSANVRDATEADTAAVLSGCSSAERDETGLATMPVRFLACDRHGNAAALAGYEVWGGSVAHVGVLVRPDRRGAGLATVVAAAAAHHALGAGLVPQWRCRLGNVASFRVRDRLGFVEVGTQVAVELASAGPVRS